jgi:opacity protein-like surface antigen
MDARRARYLARSLPLLVASVAHAQAPGEIAPQPVAVAPVVVACGHAGSVMDNRWAIGLSLGSMSLATDGAPDDRTAFAIGELALRFRATPHLELELSVGGGRERTADDQNGELAVSAATIAARYRFRPEAAWDWFVMVGLGGASVALHDATDQERSDATRPMAMLGLGIERRFGHFALQAEARAIGIGDRHDEPMDEPAAIEAAPTAMTRTPSVPSADHKRSGGSLSIGLSYYF